MGLIIFKLWSCGAESKWPTSGGKVEGLVTALPARVSKLCKSSPHCYWWLQVDALPSVCDCVCAYVNRTVTEKHFGL